MIQRALRGTNRGTAQRPAAVSLRGTGLFGALFVAAMFQIASAATETRQVFTGPVSAYAEEIADASGNAVEGGAALRIIHVEERAGAARRGDLVRVPLFFVAGECGSLDELAIVAVDGNASAEATVAWQADDVRLGEDGGVSRLHAWFGVDLAAGEKRQFHLVRRPRSGPLANGAAEAVDEVANEIRFPTEVGRVVFGTGGELRAVEAKGERWEFEGDGAFPRVELHYPKTEEQAEARVVFDRAIKARTVEWSAGALFHKLRVRIAQGEGASFEVEYRIPRHGREIVLSTATFVGPRASVAVKQSRLLEGRLKTERGEPVIVDVPAGIRHVLRAEHAYVVNALAAKAEAPALLAVPLVIGGGNGVWTTAENGAVALRGAGGLQRGDEGEKNTLHAFWTEVRLVPTTTSAVESLWRRYLEHVQPLVAIVEEPGLTVTNLNVALREVTGEMKPIGWRQQAAHALVRDDVGRMERVLKHGMKKREADVAALLGGARAAEAKLTNNGERKVREHEKGRAYGGLDPYHVTYTQSAAAGLALFGEVPELVSAVNHAMARGVREFGGRVDAFGAPYIDCFNRALNMQMGPMLFGLTAADDAGDTELVRFYRDLATAPAVQAVFGRAQRPYSGVPAKTADQTDYLYQAICDFWLRTAELLANEDLPLHPLAYARYTDCVDVMADRYHGVASRDKPDASGEARANFFRGQAHTHRWLGWSCAPYIRLLETPAERSAIGLTEAVRHTLAQKGRWKNWPDLTYYALADMLVRKGLADCEPAKLPAAPANIVAQAAGRDVEITWTAVPGAAEYRVYRAERAGGPYRWLNSAHVENAAPPLTVTRYRDTPENANAIYVVTAVDDAGRESAWRDVVE